MLFSETQKRPRSKGPRDHPGNSLLFSRELIGQKVVILYLWVFYLEYSPALKHIQCASLFIVPTLKVSINEYNLFFWKIIIYTWFK